MKIVAAERHSDTLRGVGPQSGSNAPSATPISHLTALQHAILLFVVNRGSVLMQDVASNLFGGDVASTREQTRDALAQLQRLRLIERRNDGTQSRYTASIAGAAIATQGRTP